MSHQVVVIPGDGIGREVIPAAVEVLRTVLPDLEVVPAEAGWATFERCGVAVPDETLAAIRAAGAALFGAVQSPARKVPGYRSAILTLRQELGLYANLRPVRTMPVPKARPAVDLVVVRENTEGLYVGEERWVREGEVAEATRRITRGASERIGRVALQLASQRRGRLMIAHKANILPLTDGLFRDAVRAVAAEFPAVAVDELLIDVAAYHLAARPERFDVLVAPNLYGDILSDLAAVWGGGLGLAPSLNLGAGGVGLAEPVHGSAPDIAGQGIANPVAAILSAALLVRHTWGQAGPAERIERAVNAALAAGAATPDLGGSLTTAGLTAAIRARL
ncbi:MAG: isocitrate/isopropylmalate dehydrogenase family protein [Ardenticatenaceae bacterium]|nr:isocitrate/isopropylmalate dehydrogenase family protein [Ardenticatenaceae bacterium]